MLPALTRRARTARLVVSIGLAAAAHLSIAGTAALVFVAAETEALAQKGSVTTQKLIDQAKDKFDDQQYDESIQLLSAALLKLDITTPQKVEVYRWLAYNYIVLKKDDAAKSAVYKLLAINEDFALPASESPKFREPFTKYTQQWIDDGKPGQEKPTEKPPAPVVVKHVPGSEVPHDQSIAIAGTIEDPDHRVAKVSIFYRTGSSGKFVELPSQYALGSFSANIPGSAVQPPIVEYYVQALDAGGLAIATRGDADTPLRLVVEAEKGGSIFETWWFWTGATAIVAGGIVAGILLSKKSTNTISPPPPGSTSSVTITIGE